MICEGTAIHKKTGKRIRFKVPDTFPEDSVEKLRKNLTILRINGTNLSQKGATTTGACYLIQEELKYQKSLRLSEVADNIQKQAEERALAEPGLKPWDKAQLVVDVVVRHDEIISGEKTFEQVYREELRQYRR